MKIPKLLPLALVFLLLVTVIPAVVAFVFIPDERSFTNSVDINAPVDKVWEVVNDKARFAQWHPLAVKIDVKDDRNWSEYLRDVEDPFTYSIAKDSRPGSMEIDFSATGALTGTWTGNAVATPTGTRLTTVNREKIDNSLAKVVTYLFVDRDGYAKKWNEALKAQVEKQVSK